MVVVSATLSTGWLLLLGILVWINSRSVRVVLLPELADILVATSFQILVQGVVSIKITLSRFGNGSNVVYLSN